MTVFQERHSEEVQEIINRPPHSIVRWGMTLFLGLIILMALGSWLIRYPDIISTPFTLTGVESSRPILAKGDARIVRLLGKDGEKANAGQILAYIESTADHQQVLQLERSLEQLRLSFNKNPAIVLQFSTSTYNQLGDIQNSFQIFYQQLIQLKSSLGDGFYLQKRSLLQQEYNDLIKMETTLKEQIDLQSQDLNYAKKEFIIHDKLYQGKALSPLDYQREQVKLLNKEMPIKILNSSLIQNHALQTAKLKEVLELENTISEQRGAFLQALQALQTSVEAWDQRYIIRAPITGKVSFSFPWQEQQTLALGQEFITIEPDYSNIKGLIRVPQVNLGKLHPGQVVHIKLDGYPFREYGMIDGKLSKISNTPSSDNTYWGYVDLPMGLTTRYGKRLEYRNGLKGTAEIITSNRRLVHRLINKLKYSRFE